MEEPLFEEVCEWCGCYVYFCECEDSYPDYYDDMDYFDWYD